MVPDWLRSLDQASLPAEVDLHSVRVGHLNIRLQQARAKIFRAYADQNPPFHVLEKREREKERKSALRAAGGYVDDALVNLIAALGLVREHAGTKSAGQTISLLLQALRSGEVQNRLRVRAGGPIVLDWRNAIIDLPDIRVEPHSFRATDVEICEPDLRAWLDQREALQKPPLGKQAREVAIKEVIHAVLDQERLSKKNLVPHVQERCAQQGLGIVLRELIMDLAGQPEFVSKLAKRGPKRHVPSAK